MTWVEACNDKSLQNLPHKIELNRQGKIAHLLKTLMPHGESIVECAIDTMEGTYVADATWASADRFKIIENEFSSSIAPEICVEVWSPSNSAELSQSKLCPQFPRQIG